MFNFFRKKKETVETSVSKTESSSESRIVDPNSDLAIQYYGFVEDHTKNISSLDDLVKTYTDKDDYRDKDKWLDALAICDVALESNRVGENVKELYRQIYAMNRNKYVSMDYDEADYDFWFHKNVEINDRFIRAGVIRGYCEQADLLGSARRGYQDNAKKQDYLKRGVEAGDAASLGDFGYNLFMGNPNYGEQDKTKGRQMVEKAKELGYELAELQLLYLDFDKLGGEADAQFLQRVEQMIETREPSSRKPYNLLADYYSQLRVDVDLNLSDDEQQAKIEETRQEYESKTVKALKNGAEAGNPYCKYFYATRFFGEETQGVDKSVAIRMLEEAFDDYVLYAGSYLGGYYRYGNDGNASIEKAIEWYAKASLYCFEQASYELATIYLYDEQHKDIEKGLKYLDFAIEDGSSVALIEKAYLTLETSLLPRNVEEAKGMLFKALDMGSEYAAYRIGLCYQDGIFDGESNYEKALEYFEIGSKSDHLYSLETAGNYYRIGVGGTGEEAQSKAVDYLLRAIRLGSNYARVELGFCYEMGFGVEKDYQKAFDLYQEAADNDYPYANIKLATYYEEGVLGESNFEEALQHLNIAADAGLPEAIYNKGRFYKYSVGVPENPTEAMHLFEQASATGNLPALVEIALAYETEYAGTVFDAQKAIDYMTQAAEKGYAYAQYKLGLYYYYGLLDTNMDKAFEWFMRAYEENAYSYAAIMLGDYYVYNAGGLPEPEYAKAYEYYKFAADRGVISEGLGVCYEYGLGVEESETEAFKYYSLSANDGYATAKFRLGLCYKYGSGTSVNLTEAYRWLSDAAQDGNYNAQFHTALMLLDGEGVGQDEQQGVQMLTSVAEMDHDHAQFELANCYLTGRGVPEDEVQAMYWYQRAAENGNENAQKIVGRRDRRKE